MLAERRERQGRGESHNKGLKHNDGYFSEEDVPESEGQTPSRRK
jgi:hypothetical protein